MWSQTEPVHAHDLNTAQEVIMRKEQEVKGRKKSTRYFEWYNVG